MFVGDGLLMMMMMMMMMTVGMMDLHIQVIDVPDSVRHKLALASLTATKTIFDEPFRLASQRLLVCVLTPHHTYIISIIDD